jgi:hypothetical protein
LIRYLLLLQFPLLYVTSLIAGLGAYWVGRDIGRLYVVMLLMLVALHLLVRRRRARLSALSIAIPLLLAGTAAAAWAYRPLHLGSWEVSSLWQVVRLGTLGIFSLLASHLATELPPGGRYSLAAGLALTGLLWVPSMDYALMPLLFAGLIQAAALGFLPPRTAERTAPAARVAPGRLTGLARYGVLLAALTVGETIMDYQEDTRWAWHLVIALVTAALATSLERWQPGRALIGAVTLGAATFLATALSPDLLLHPAHAVAAGLVLGSAFAHLDRQGGAAALIGATTFWALGLALSFGLARNLGIGAWRALLLIPVPILMLTVFRSGRATAERT